jgi:hypothetical protein
MGLIYLYLYPPCLKLLAKTLRQPEGVNTGLFEMTVGVLTTFHLVLQMQPHVIYFYQVYVPPLPASIPELKVRIRTAIETITADMLQTVWNQLDYSVGLCRITKGAHIEHL